MTTPSLSLSYNLCLVTYFICGPTMIIREIDLTGDIFQKITQTMVEALSTEICRVRLHTESSHKNRCCHCQADIYIIHTGKLYACAESLCSSIKMDFLLPENLAFL